jgi:hypothetical protein
MENMEERQVWIVIKYEQYGRKASWIVRRYVKYGIK